MKHHYKGCAMVKSEKIGTWVWWDKSSPRNYGIERTMGNCKVTIDWYRRKQSDEQNKGDKEYAELL